MHHWVFLGYMRQACLQNKILQLQWPTTETKNLTAKTKYLTAKPKTSRQKQKPHGKTKDLLDLTAKANTHGKTKAIFCCYEVFDFAVRFLVLPWGILFLP